MTICSLDGYDNIVDGIYGQRPLLFAGVFNRMFVGINGEHWNLLKALINAGEDLNTPAYRNFSQECRDPNDYLECGDTILWDTRLRLDLRIFLLQHGAKLNLRPMEKCGISREKAEVPAHVEYAQKVWIDGWFWTVQPLLIAKRDGKCSFGCLPHELIDLIFSKCIQLLWAGTDDEKQAIALSSMWSK